MLLAISGLDTQQHTQWPLCPCVETSNIGGEVSGSFLKPDDPHAILSQRLHCNWSNKLVSTYNYPINFRLLSSQSDIYQDGLWYCFHLVSLEPSQDRHHAVVWHHEPGCHLLYEWRFDTCWLSPWFSSVFHAMQDYCPSPFVCSKRCPKVSERKVVSLHYLQWQIGGNNLSYQG